MDLTSFLSKEELKITTEFLENGYTIFPIDCSDGNVVDEIRAIIYAFSKEYLKLAPNVSIDDFFNHTDNFLSFDQINDLKLKLMALTSRDGVFHSKLYFSAKKYLDLIIGNEVCMQRSLNMSIQLPQDESALLPLHTDVWSGNSPYEVVFWLPLVNCFNTKSMYVLPIQKSLDVFKNFELYENLNAEELYQKLKKDMVFVNVPKNHAIIFSHSILHGNRLNTESETRWTYNIRFKSVLSPFGTKGLGEAFIPINLKPATRIGFSNVIPKLTQKQNTNEK